MMVAVSRDTTNSDDGEYQDRILCIEAKKELEGSARYLKVPWWGYLKLTLIMFKTLNNPNLITVTPPSGIEYVTLTAVADADKTLDEVVDGATKAVARAGTRAKAAMQENFILKLKMPVML